MIVAGRYSVKGGLEVVTTLYPDLLQEIEAAIRDVRADDHQMRRNKERDRRRNAALYSAAGLNKAIKAQLSLLEWKPARVVFDFPTEYYTVDYQKHALRGGAFREMDMVKWRLGVEVEFEKHPLMIYSGCAKMTIFSNLGIIDAGVEIVPVKELTDQMSSAVSYFEQFVWDLEQRGTADIDIPVLILGVTA